MVVCHLGGARRVHHPAVGRRVRRRGVAVRVHVVEGLVDGAGRAAARVHDAAAAVSAVVAVGVVAGAGRGVPAGDDVPHVEAAPGQARQVAVVEGEVFRLRDRVG